MIVVAAGLAALAGWLALPSPPRQRFRDISGPPSVPDTAPSRWLGPVGGISMVMAVALLAGPSAGLLAGVAVLFLLPRVLRRLRTQAEVASVRAMRRQLPSAVDLLAATLRAGVPVGSALDAVARAQDEPLRSALVPVAAALDLGASSGEAWAQAARVDALTEVAAAFTRSAATGSSLSVLLSDLARDMRQRRRSELEVLTREVGVRSFFPLATCFLPAFIVLAGIPTVITMAQGTGLLDQLSPSS